MNKRFRQILKCVCACCFAGGHIFELCHFSFLNICKIDIAPVYKKNQDRQAREEDEKERERELKTFANGCVA